MKSRYLFACLALLGGCSNVRPSAIEPESLVVPEDLAAEPARAPPLTITSVPCPVEVSSVGSLAAPVTSGALRMFDVTGDDRLAFDPALVSWSPNNVWLVVGTETQVQLWNAATGQLDLSVPLPRSGRLATVPTLSHDTEWIAVVTASREVWLLSTRGLPARSLGAMVGRPLLTRRGSPAGLHFSKDGLRLNGASEVWDTVSGSKVWSAPPASSPNAEDWLIVGDGRHGLRGTRVSTDGGPPSFRHELVELQTGVVRHVFPPGRLLSSFSSSEAGERVASVSREGLLSVFDLEANRVVLQTDTHGAVVVSLLGRGELALTGPYPTSDRFSVTSQNELWEVDEGRVRWTSSLGTMSSDLSSDGEWLLNRPGSGTPQLQHLPDGKESRMGLWVVGLSPDATYVLVRETGGVEVRTQYGDLITPPLPRSRVLARSIDGTRSAVEVSGGALQLVGPEGCFDLGLGFWPRATAALTRDARFGFSPSGETFFVGFSGGEDPSLRAFSTRDGSLKWSRAELSTWAGFSAEAGVVLVHRGRHPLIHRFAVDTGSEVLPPWPAPRRTEFDRLPQVRAFSRRGAEGAMATAYDDFALAPNQTSLADASYFAAPDAVASEWWLVVGPPGDPRVSRTFEPPRRRVSPPLEFDEMPAPEVVASPDSERFALRSGSTVMVVRGERSWNCSTPDALRSVQFTSSSRKLITRSQQRMRVLDAETCAVLGEAQFPGDPPSLVWVSPDEKRLEVDTRYGRRVRFSLGDK